MSRFCPLFLVGCIVEMNVTLPNNATPTPIFYAWLFGLSHARIVWLVVTLAVAAPTAALKRGDFFLLVFSEPQMDKQQLGFDDNRLSRFFYVFNFFLNK